mgnify:CR=1 FL=1
MRNIFLIAKTLLKSGGAGLTEGRQKRSGLAVLIALLFAFALFAVSIGAAAAAVIDGLSATHNEAAILSLVFGAASIVIFLFGVFYVISVMYHSNDIELFGYLPVKQYEMLSAKFLTLVVYEYIFEAFILIPVLAVYGFKSGAGVTYIVYSVILFLTTPVIALSMAAVIVIVLMRFTSFGKNKQVFRFIGGIIAIIFAIGLNLILQTSLKRADDAQLIAAIQNSELASLFGNIFPGIGFASGALADAASFDGFLSLLAFLLCSAAAFFVFLLAGLLFYRKGAAGITETAAKRQGVKDIGKEVESSPAVYSYVKKELRLLLRSPVAFINCVLITFIWPVLILIGFLGGGNSSFAQVSAFVSGAHGGVVIAVLTAFSAFMSSANSITSTAISREGKSVYFMKYIPMSVKSQLAAKLVPGVIFSGISVLLVMIMAALFGAKMQYVLFALVPAVIAVVACSYIGIAVDASRPKLDWINEQQGIKQNLNVVLHMLSGLAAGAAAVVPVVAFGMSETAAAVYETGFFLLLLIIMRNYTHNRAALKLIRMDV